MKFSSTVFIAMTGSSVTVPALVGNGPFGSHDVTLHVGVTRTASPASNVSRVAAASKRTRWAAM